MALLGALIAGAAAVFFAIMMVLQRSLYASAVCLLAVLLQASVLFYISGAPLLAFLQIMVYAGAVMVLIVVAIMASPVSSQRRWSALSIPRPLAVLGLLLPVAQAAALAFASGAASAPGGGDPALAQAALGAVLFGPYALATEAAALLLFLSALVLIEAKR